jgi:hypothetical protein
MENSDNLSERILKMSSTEEATFLLRQLALPAPAGDSTKSAISRAHRVLKTWTWNRVRDVWHADPRISVSADELDQLRNLVRCRKYKRNGKGAAWDDTLGFLERVAAIEAELRELRALLRLLPDSGGALLGAGRAAQQHGAPPFCPGKRDGAEGGAVTAHPPGPVMAFDPRNAAAKNARQTSLSNMRSARRIYLTLEAAVDHKLDDQAVHRLDLEISHLLVSHRPAKSAAVARLPRPRRTWRRREVIRVLD